MKQTHILKTGSCVLATAAIACAIHALMRKIKRIGTIKILNQFDHQNAAIIHWARQAIEKSGNADIKSYAEEMINAHQQIEEELNSLIPKGCCPGKDTDDDLKNIKSLKGRKLEQALLNKLKAEHKKALSLLHCLHCSQPNIKHWAQTTLHTLNQHLQSAPEIQDHQQRSREE